MNDGARAWSPEGSGGASGMDMIGIVIVTHGNLAKEFRAALEHVVGPQEQIAAICIKPDDNMEERRTAIIKAIAAVDKGDGCVLLTDMFGGTPSNLAISAMDDARVEVIAGINLPMLVKLARVREEAPLAEAIKLAQDAGRKYIHVASHVLTSR
jgi:PTS system mannose-specific IIA component